LILFMTATVADGGLGLDTATAAAIYGFYTSAVYFMGIPGGWIADRLLGQRKAVLYGGILIAMGHYSLALNMTPAFYGGLVSIVLGTGLLKPNISSIVGQLYSAEDQRRDAGFSLLSTWVLLCRRSFAGISGSEWVGTGDSAPPESA